MGAYIQKTTFIFQTTWHQLQARDWLYFMLQPKAELTYRLQTQCINQCYTKLRPTQLKQKSNPTDNDYGNRYLAWEKERERLTLFHVTAKRWISAYNQCINNFTAQHCKLLRVAPTQHIQLFPLTVPLNGTVYRTLPKRHWSRSRNLLKTILLPSNYHNEHIGGFPFVTKAYTDSNDLLTYPYITDKFPILFIYENHRYVC